MKMVSHQCFWGLFEFVWQALTILERQESEWEFNYLLLYPCNFRIRDHIFCYNGVVHLLIHVQLLILFNANLLGYSLP